MNQGNGQSNIKLTNTVAEDVSQIVQVQDSELKKLREKQFIWIWMLAMAQTIPLLAIFMVLDLGLHLPAVWALVAVVVLGFLNLAFIIVPQVKKRVK